MAAGADPHDRRDRHSQRSSRRKPPSHRMAAYNAAMDTRFPHRIVCLTEEPTEVLYALGRAGPHRRHFGLHGATAARAAREAQGLGLHQRARGRDPQARTGPRHRLLRHPGRYRAGADQGRDRGLDQQPPLGRGHRGLRAAPGRDGRRRRSRRPLRRDARGARRVGARRGGRAAAAPAGLFRGMGRALHQRHPLGLRAGADRRRRRRVSRTGAGIAGAGAHPRRSGRGRAAPAAAHHRFLVRQEIPARTGRGARRAGMRSRPCATASCTK